MTHKEVTGVTFNYLDTSETWISRSSEFFIVSNTETVLNTVVNIPHRVHIL